MIKSLKNHPFAVEAFFESSLVLTYAIPKEKLQGFIPECLELDTYQDTWAFVAVAMVQTKDLRPKGLPRFLGNDFFLIGFRIFVKYINQKGKRLRGLYIIKSATDKKKMERMGNLFTHYNYSTVDIQCTRDNQKVHIHSVNAELNIRVDVGHENIRLPSGSPFSDWKEARRYAGPLPFTFTYNADTKEVLIIEGVRQHWLPQPVKVISSQVGLLEKWNLEEAVLANAFLVEKIPYYWKKGIVEKWSR